MNSGERKGFTTRSVSVQTLLRSGHESGDQNLQAHHIVKFVELAGSWNTMNPADPRQPSPCEFTVLQCTGPECKIEQHFIRQSTASRDHDYRQKATGTPPID